MNSDPQGEEQMLLKVMGTLALLSTTAVNHAPQSASKAQTTQVATKAAPVQAKSEQKSQVVAKAEDKKAETAKPEATDGGTPAPTKKGGGKK
jgi:hypothetical protein